MNTFIFQPGLTWRKAGYYFQSNSLAYRDVLEANPEWDITRVPPPGSVLNEPLSTGSGGLSMAPIGTVPIYSGSNPETYYPFDDQNSYILATIRYSSSALRSVEECNGYTTTSDRVILGESYVKPSGFFA